MKHFFVSHFQTSLISPQKKHNSTQVLNMLFSVLALSAVVSFVTASSEVPSLSLQKRTDFDGDCDDDDGYAATVTSYFARPTHSAYNASEVSE